MKKYTSSLSVTNSPLHPIYTQYKEIAHYWMLNILIPLGAHKRLIMDNLCSDDDVLHELGLSNLVDNNKYDAVAARQELHKQFNELKGSVNSLMPTNTQLAKNIVWLGKTLGLNKTEQSILHFRVIASRHLPLRACLNSLNCNLDHLSTIHLISRLIEEKESQVELALNPKSTLIRTGLMTVLTKLESLTDKVRLLSGLADNLLAKHDNPYSIFTDNFSKAISPKLTILDYPHLSDDISLLKSYLIDALEKKRQGVNILIHGSPGSGKTEFVKMLANEIGHPLFEVACENSDGEPVRRSNRFRSFRLSQHVLGTDTPRPLILFDEIEDVFNIEEDNEESELGNSSGMKGWINKLLEENQIPSFWLSNNLRCIDNAFIRRFDYVIELNTPPRSVRSKILGQYLDGIEVSASWKSNMAEHEYLNPAVVERAAKVIEIAKQQQPELLAEKALGRIMGNTLEAMGLPRVPKNPLLSVSHYRLDVLNTDCNIAEVCDGLRQHGEGRLCLYGPPGTGKSAFGRYLAEKLDRPLMLRRASDILSPYLGITERNMAKMFVEAEAENAVLLLDEADSFLRDRNGATRSWEVSEVNEMLTQMESFTGIFIASTNLMGSLDAAALRRFDMKVKFDYLKPEQAWQLFLDTAANFQLEVTDENKAALCKGRILTPGDFANVERQSRLSKIRSSHELIDRLLAECKAKPEGAKQSIGF